MQAERERTEATPDLGVGRILGSHCARLGETVDPSKIRDVGGDRT